MGNEDPAPADVNSYNWLKDVSLPVRWNLDALLTEADTERELAERKLVGAGSIQPSPLWGVAEKPRQGLELWRNEQLNGRDWGWGGVAEKCPDRGWSCGGMSS